MPVIVSGGEKKEKKEKENKVLSATACSGEKKGVKVLTVETRLFLYKQFAPKTGFGCLICSDIEKIMGKPIYTGIVIDCADDVDIAVDYTRYFLSCDKQSKEEFMEVIEAVISAKQNEVDKNPVLGGLRAGVVAFKKLVALWQDESFLQRFQ